MNQKEVNNTAQWPWYQLKYELAEFILDRLKKYKESYNQNGHSLPDWVLGETEKKDSYSKAEEAKMKQEWNKELDIIIAAFKQVLNYNLQFDVELEYNEEKIQEGLNKFSKYYLHLWD